MWAEMNTSISISVNNSAIDEEHFVVQLRHNFSSNRQVPPDQFCEV